MIEVIEKYALVIMTFNALGLTLLFVAIDYLSLQRAMRKPARRRSASTVYQEAPVAMASGMPKPAYSE